ncbi:hypothetical protein AAER44_17210, partial [Acinetobacter baumannii]
IFIRGLGWGVEGAAIATNISQAIAFIKIKSNTIFIDEAIPKYNNERFELPTEFKIPASIL